MSKNTLLLVNSKLNNMTVLSKMLEIINNSNLPEAEKTFEREIAKNIIQNNAISLTALQNEGLLSKFYKTYSYLAGYTNIPLLEDDELIVNSRFHTLTSTMGDITKNLTGIPKFGPKAAIASTVLGTSTSCGIIGGLFNTKQCREKRGATQNLQNPISALQATQLQAPAQQNIASQLPQPINIPSSVPTSLQTSVPSVARSFTPEPNANTGAGGIMETLRKNWVIVAVIAVAIGYFMFFRKKR